MTCCILYYVASEYINHIQKAVQLIDWLIFNVVCNIWLYLQNKIQINIKWYHLRFSPQRHKTTKYCPSLQWCNVQPINNLRLQSRCVYSDWGCSGWGDFNCSGMGCPTRVSVPLTGTLSNWSMIVFHVCRSYGVAQMAVLLLGGYWYCIIIISIVSCWATTGYWFSEARDHLIITMLTIA